MKLTPSHRLYGLGAILLVTLTISGVERLKLNNEVAGFKFAVVGLFYGVLLAFVVIAVWDEYRNTETAVRNEAKAAVDLHALPSLSPSRRAPRSGSCSSPIPTMSANMSGRPWRMGS